MLPPLGLPSVILTRGSSTRKKRKLERKRNHSRTVAQSIIESNRSTTFIIRKIPKMLNMKIKALRTNKNHNYPTNKKFLIEMNEERQVRKQKEQKERTQSSKCRIKIGQISSSACLASTLAICRRLPLLSQIQFGTPHLKDRPLFA